MQTFIRTFVVLFFVFGSLSSASAQSSFPYDISLVPVSVPNLPGLHSYAFAQHNGKWLFIGGRTDGLHARQPFNSFPASENNTTIYVVDVATSAVWTASITSLPTGLEEQLQATNMNFNQVGDALFIVGGYAYSASANNHITFPYLTTIDVPGLMDAVINGTAITPYFKQIQDDAFAVTGGHLDELNGTFYLVGGHRFDGRYNPMGNPTYTQTYTNAIRTFTIDNNGSNLSFGNYSEVTDPVHLRRRDYNLLPQIFPNGEQGFTISSGVFQMSVDLPFLYPVDITETGYTPMTGFNQYLSNYHSAFAVLYDATENNMHSVFFGGMSQYYYNNGTLIQDDLVPFVKTISRLSRDANGTLSEHVFPTEMPELQGASAEFIPNLSLPQYDTNIFKLDELGQGSVLLGHVFGGIYSSSLNPFSVNQTNLTSADDTLYEVWLTYNPLSVSEFVEEGSHSYGIQVHPNPFQKEFEVSFSLDRNMGVRFIITNALGQVVYTSRSLSYEKGSHEITLDTHNQASGIYYVTFIFEDTYYATQKIIKE